MNWALSSVREGSLEMTLTVPLNLIKYKNILSTSTIDKKNGHMTIFPELKPAR